MTSIKNEFQSSLYRCTSEMVVSIAQEWITAGGSWNDETIAEILCERSDEALAAECIEGFGLNVIPDFADDFSDDEPQSHMAFNEYDAADLARAFREMRQ